MHEELFQRCLQTTMTQTANWSPFLPPTVGDDQDHWLEIEAALSPTNAYGAIGLLLPDDSEYDRHGCDDPIHPRSIDEPTHQGHEELQQRMPKSHPLLTDQTIDRLPTVVSRRMKF